MGDDQRGEGASQGGRCLLSAFCFLLHHHHHHQQRTAIIIQEGKSPLCSLVASKQGNTRNGGVTPHRSAPAQPHLLTRTHRRLSFPLLSSHSTPRSSADLPHIFAWPAAPEMALLGELGNGATLSGRISNRSTSFSGVSPVLACLRKGRLCSAEGSKRKKTPPSTCSGKACVGQIAMLRGNQLALVSHGPEKVTDSGATARDGRFATKARWSAHSSARSVHAELEGRKLGQRVHAHPVALVHDDP